MAYKVEDVDWDKYFSKLKRLQNKLNLKRKKEHDTRHKQTSV